MVTIIQGDSLTILKTLPDESVNCCVTSPPYWGLRDYGCSGQLGLEKTPEEYVAKMVEVFREIRRVLRKDATLWLNMGDCYASGGKHNNEGFNERWHGKHFLSNKQGGTDQERPERPSVQNLKPKDLMGIPWRVAFALQADGWYLRMDIIWAKPNPMPESVQDRPTKAHEYIFLMSKSAKYYYDAEAIKELIQSGPSDIRKMIEKKDRYDAKHFHNDPGPLAAANYRTHIGKKRAVGGSRKPAGWQSGPGAHDSIPKGRYPDSFKGSLPGRKDGPGQDRREKGDRIHGNLPGRDDGGLACNDSTQLYRNKRSVWTVATQPYADAHFATFPEKLVKPCILAGCPQGGTVLDPFAGSGTTGMVAEYLGRNSILIELKPEYCEMARERTAQGGLFCAAGSTCKR